ncbi:MAG: transcription-repair coupling factor [Candidatus Hydrogenedentes bacterium]|nr:transcription-repair coupling factor [Candidatus Hydrogenedentota bacterium]
MNIPETTCIKKIVGAIKSHPRAEIELAGGWGASKTLAALQTAQCLGRSLLVIAPDRIEAEAIFDDLATFAGEEHCVMFPAWEVLPDDTMSPADDIVAERMNALERLNDMGEEDTPAYVIAPVRSFMQHVIARQQLRNNSLSVSCGEVIPMGDILDKLIRLGYTRESMVEQRGEFSVRGGILDIFSISAELPFRIEYFDDEIESMRLFEPETQRSVTRIESMRIPPRSEKAGLVSSRKDHKMETLLSYLPKNTLVAMDEPLAIAEHASRVAAQCADSPFFMDWDQMRSCIGHFSRLSLVQMPRRDATVAARFTMYTSSVASYAGEPDAFWEQLRDWELDGCAIRIFCVNSGERRRFLELLGEHGYRFDKEDSSVSVAVGRLRAGFVSHTDKLVFLSEREIFGRHYVRRKRRRFEAGVALTQYGDLRAGDFVVHEVHGIGRYQGLRQFSGRTGDYLAVHYAGGDTIYVPATHLDQLQKYLGGDGAMPKIDRLGGASWARTRERVKRAVREITTELLKLYSTRENRDGYAFAADTPWQVEFEDAFEYEETPDQQRAINDVKRDMESLRPMDRLLCGDVGFGKTEVAIRAAFKAIMEKKQVALLAPTTVLVQQHYTTFRERFADYPIHVEVLNRFRSPKEIKDTLSRLKSGETDIVIGTHRLLSKDVEFHDLGLAVIDEEQRFGVRHKERLKQMRTFVDVLTMSATPIPRTLHFSLLGIRDMSLINTAPNDRLPIHTCIEAWDKNIICEALLRELSRQGQVYFLHNRVQSIDRVVSFIHQLVPQARVGLGHGQMNKHELEEVMTAFVNHEIDVLVCTTIIASGIDIPNANTIIVDRADNFGLSQLYQIRGRVGRYKHRAFAYMLVPGDRVLSEDAQLRLKALEDFSALGSGFRVAMRDLEIRGAGDLLGADQTGHIASVGYETYKDLIAEAISEVQGKPLRRRNLPPFEIASDAYIPDSYVQSAPQKITLYRRVAGATSLEEIQELKLELKDRFGPLPKPTLRLLQIMETRALAVEIRAVDIEASSSNIIVRFETGDALAPAAQSQLRSIYGNALQFAWSDKPAVTVVPDKSSEPLITAYKLIKVLHQMLHEDEEIE